MTTNDYSFTVRSGFLEPRGSANDLFRACKIGNLSSLQRSLAQFSNPNIRNEHGDTPLHVCAHHGHPRCAQLLLEAGADINATNGNKYSALQVAIEAGRLNVIILLFQHFDTLKMPNYKPLLHATKRCLVPVVQELLRRGHDPNMVSQCGNTALHFAVSVSSQPVLARQMVKMLLCTGANPEIKNNSNKTPNDYSKYPRIIEEVQHEIALENQFRMTIVRNIVNQPGTALNMSFRGNIGDLNTLNHIHEYL